MVEAKELFETLVRTPPAAERQLDATLRFDRNERTTPFPPDHLRAFLDSIDPVEIVAYPQLEPFYVRLADYLGINRDQLILSSGSDTAIKSVFEVFVDKQDEVVMLSHTYAMYEVYCRMYGADPVAIPYGADFSLSTGNICSAINGKTKLVALANPNHTGTVIEKSGLIDILETANKHNALLLIDEAYFHFYDDTMLPLIGDFDNLVVVRTFSKAFGLAGARIGYAAGCARLIQLLGKARLTHEITALSAKLGLYLLDHPEILEENLRDVNMAKDVLYTRMPEMGCEVMESQANFVYFKLPARFDGAKLVDELATRRILIKGPFDAAPFSGQLRVTVGTAAQMEAFCDVISEALRST